MDCGDGAGIGAATALLLSPTQRPTKSIRPGGNHSQIKIWRAPGLHLPEHNYPSHHSQSIVQNTDEWKGARAGEGHPKSCDGDRRLRETGPFLRRRHNKAGMHTFAV